MVADYIPFEEPGGWARTSTTSTRTLSTSSTSTATATGGTTPRTSSASRPRSRNQNTFLYNTGPITSLNDPDWNVRQFYSVTRVDSLRAPDPARHAPRLTAEQHRPALDARLRQPRGGGGERRFRAASRSSPASVTTRSSSTSGRSSTSPASGRSTRSTCSRCPRRQGVDGVAGFNVHSIAIQVPIDPRSSRPSPTIGVWASASRPNLQVLTPNGELRNVRSRGTGLAARQPARQRGPDPARPEGLLEQPEPA